MKQSVFMLRLENGEFMLSPFKHNPKKNVLTPEGFREKKRKKK